MRFVQLEGMEINLKLTISYVLPAVFVLLLVACGDSQPLPDIEATVEARVQAGVADTVEAKAEAMAKPMAEANWNFVTIS
jgi:hypothetical protein